MPKIWLNGERKGCVSKVSIGNCSVLSFRTPRGVVDKLDWLVKHPSFSRVTTNPRKARVFESGEEITEILNEKFDSRFRRIFVRYSACLGYEHIEVVLTKESFEKFLQKDTFGGKRLSGLPFFFTEERSLMRGQTSPFNIQEIFDSFPVEEKKQEVASSNDEDDKNFYLCGSVLRQVPVLA